MNQSLRINTVPNPTGEALNWTLTVGRQGLLNVPPLTVYIYDIGLKIVDKNLYRIPDITVEFVENL